MPNHHLPPPPLCHHHHHHLPLFPHAAATTSIFSTPSPFYYHLHLPIPPHHATPPPPPLSLPLFHVDNISLFSSLRPASPPSHVLLPHMHIVNLRSTNTPKFSTSNASMLDMCWSWTYQRHFCICPHCVKRKGKLSYNHKALDSKKKKKLKSAKDSQEIN